MSKAIEKLRNDADYYGEFGRQFLSNSDIRDLLTNPRSFKKPTPKTKAMVEGSYLHTLVLEPHKAESFLIVDASTRTTKVYKEAVEASGEEILLLQSEASNIESLVKAIKSNLYFYDQIYADGNLYEEPMVMELHGQMWKGKADIVTEDFVIDIKTTSDIDQFKWSAKRYNYDSQCYLYQMMFGKPLFFFVIDKDTRRLGVFEPSEAFINEGKEKVLRAIEVYERFFGPNKTEDVDNYFMTETL
jgi:hypothetical protein